jgi:hypothetical protein
MFGFGKPKGLVGLDIGSSSVKVVELRKKGSAYELLNLGIENLGQDTVVDGAIMDSFSVSNAIEKIFSESKIKSKHVATSVSGHSVIVKKISVNAPTEDEVANAIPYEAQQYIPFDMADVNLSYQVLGPAQAGPGFDVMLVAVKRDKILNHTNVLSQAGKAPAVVDIDAFALQNALRTPAGPHDRLVEHRRQHHEYQHGAGRGALVHPRRFGGRQPIHRHPAKGTRSQFRGCGEAQAGSGSPQCGSGREDPAHSFRLGDFAPGSAKDL